MRSRDEIKDFLKNVKSKDILDLAMEFARFAHDGQKDKAGAPYIGHLERVAAITQDRYEDKLLTAVAWLHDTVEDGGFTISDLMMFFPTVVWKVIAVLTRGKTTDRDKYISDVGKNYLAAKVKICDLEDNMDLSRIPFPTQKDYDRNDHYRSEYRRLNDAIIEWEGKLDESERDTEFYGEFYC